MDLRSGPGANHAGGSTSGNGARLTVTGLCRFHPLERIGSLILERPRGEWLGRFGTMIDAAALYFFCLPRYVNHIAHHLVHNAYGENLGSHHVLCKAPC
jgi:hypothetical protein